MKTGKAISNEFKNEVMDRVKQLCHLSTRATYSYSAVRECAIKIFDKDYWDDHSKKFIKNGIMIKEHVNYNSLINGWLEC